MSWEKSINTNTVTEIICGSHIFLGAGAIQKMDHIAQTLSSKGVDSIIAMTGKAAYEKTGAWAVVTAALDKHKIKYTLYNKVQPNPETHQVDEATAIAIAAGAKAVIAIGGGSPIDAAKSVAILINYPEKTCEQLYSFEFTPDSAVPTIAINLTHGTGSEANRFAVVTIPEKNHKPAIAYDCIYPMFSIDDPALMTGLPADQTVFVSVDAVNHVIEAATTILANPFAMTIAKETIRLVAQNLPKVIANPKDIDARYFLTYASLIAGTAFDNGMLHLTHALEHPLSGVKSDLSHGLGLAIILPAIIKQIYKEKSGILSDILSPIVPSLCGDASEAQKAADGVRAWLVSVGITQTLSTIGFSQNDVPALVDLAFTTPGLAGLISLSPVEGSREVVEAIYRDSM